MEENQEMKVGGGKEANRNKIGITMWYTPAPTLHKVCEPFATHALIN